MDYRNRMQISASYSVRTAKMGIKYTAKMELVSGKIPTFKVKKMASEPKLWQNILSRFNVNTTPLRAAIIHSAFNWLADTSAQSRY